MIALRRTAVSALAALALCLAGAQSAVAYWTGSGSGVGTATTATMPGGIQPTISASGTTVTVSIPQISVAGQFIGALGGSYAVQRYPATAGAGVTPASGSCSSAVTGATATLTCAETDTPRGDWKYTVSPTLFMWTSAESIASSTIVLAPDAPTGLTLTLRPAASIQLDWTAGDGATGYNVYRRSGAGTYNFSAPINGATPVIGTTYTDTTSVSGTSYRYVVRSRVVGSAGQQIESGNSNEPAAVTADGTLPTGVTLNAVATPLRGTVAVSGNAADTISGVATWSLEYKLSSGSTWWTGCTDNASPWGCGWDTTAVPDGLYDLRARATDVAGNTRTSTIRTNRRVDNTPPSVTLNDPGIYLRGTINFTATASDTGSGLATLAIQRKPSASGTWTTICSGTTSPRNCAFNTTSVADGSYDFRALGTDVVGNEGYMEFSGRVIDNTPPVVSDIQTTNVSGGTVGLPESGDTIIYTYSEEMAPATIAPSWDGSALAVSVRFEFAFGGDTLTVYNGANSTELALGDVALGSGYINFWTWLFGGGNPRFNATMVQNGSTVTITLGSLAASSVQTSAGNRTLVWTGNTANTDLAGNPLTASSATESGPAGPDF